MVSIWQQASEATPTDEFEPGRRYEAVVVGAGLTGLVTAVLLARAGLRVAVVEAGRVGSGTTGGSSAKLSLLQGATLQAIARRHPAPVVRAYLEANREGQSWLIRYLEENSVPVQYRDAYTMAIAGDCLPVLRAEAAASRAAGLALEELDVLPLPFPTAGALRLARQVQLDPMQVLMLLAAELRERGGMIFEQTRMLGLNHGAPLGVRTTRGALQADQLVLATGIPVLDRGGHFARLVPSRSHLMAYRLPPEADFPQGMFLAVDPTGQSLRTARDEAGMLLLVGGYAERVGRGNSAAARTKLDSWTRTHFPVVEQVAAWSAQDYLAAGALPLVGQLPGGNGSIHAATGFNKWGMTNAVAAGLSISAEILGGRLPWAETLHKATAAPSAWRDGAGMNAKVAALLAGGWARALAESPGGGDDGTGPARSRVGLRPVAQDVEIGCRVSRVCTHLGGVLQWNDAEQSWDCPLHGSRFSAHGERLEGPATRDLPTYGPGGGKQG